MFFITQHWLFSKSVEQLNIIFSPETATFILWTDF